MLSEESLERYAHQVIIDDIGEEGQLLLQDSKVLVVGLGGLGCPASSYLAASGVGLMGLCDFDIIQRSNLTRQLLYREQDLGKLKVEVAHEALWARNSEVTYELWTSGINKDNVKELVSKYDIVLDCADNVSVSYLLNDVCYSQKKPLVWCGVQRYEVQVGVYCAYKGEEYACYRCLNPSRPPLEELSRCDLVGMFGFTTAVGGVIQAAETIKMIIKQESPLTNKLLFFDTQTMNTYTINMSRRCRVSLEACEYCHD